MIPPSLRTFSASRFFRLMLAAVLGMVLRLEAGPSPAARGGLSGPVPMRILAPIPNLFFQFTPERAETLGDGVLLIRTDLSESNVIQVPEEPETEFTTRIDGEITRFNLNLRYGLGDRWDLGLEAPILATHSGFLDSFIEDVEDLIGSLKVRRKNTDQDQFDYRVTRNRQVFFRGKENRVGLGDIAVTLKRRLVVQNGWVPGLALRGAFKLPTGNEELMFGSGRPDVALGLAAELGFGRLGLNANLNTTIPLGNDLPAFAGLNVRPITSGHVGVEYRSSEKFSWHLQFAGSMSPYSLDNGRGPSAFDTSRANGVTSNIFQLTPAFAWRPKPNMQLFVGLVEDFLSSDDISSDLTLFISFSYHIRRK